MAPGVKVTVKPVLAAAPTGATGAVVTAKSPAFGPSTAIARPVRSTAPTFFSTKFVLAFAPTATTPHATLPPSGIPDPAGCSIAISAAGNEQSVSTQPTEPLLTPPVTAARARI